MSRSTAHATFVIEREYRHPPAKVFGAFADLESKKKWFGGPDEWETASEHRMDFHVRGTESASGGPRGGPVHTYNATYWDIVENERIVSSYEMHLDRQRISVSLATMEFKPKNGGTIFVLTEQGVFLDSYDDAGQREEGTRALLDQLEAYLNA